MNDNKEDILAIAKEALPAYVIRTITNSDGDLIYVEVDMGVAGHKTIAVSKTRRKPIWAQGWM